MPKSISSSNTCTTKIQPEPLLSFTSKPSTSVDVANTASEPVVCPSSDVSGQLPSQAPQETTEPRKIRITPVVLRDASKWRAVNHKFISIGIKIERAVAVDAGIGIIPRSEDDYREVDVPHHTFPLPSERNIHAVIRRVPATLKEADIKEELQQKGYAPLHIIRLKRSGAPMPLVVVVILPKLEKSRELFNEHELLYKAQIRPSLEYCSHVWSCAPKHSLRLLDSIQNRAVRLIDAPNLTRDLDSLEHRRRVAALSLFYRFYHGRCSRELSQIITPKAVRKKNTREALRAHPYQVEIATPRTSLLQHSFFWRTSTLWNELPGNLFPDGYNLQRFKTNVHRHLSSRSASEAP
nr:unnamed protein product [Callosobruchus analis]